MRIKTINTAAAIAFAIFSTQAFDYDALAQRKNTPNTDNIGIGVKINIKKLYGGKPHNLDVIMTNQKTQAVYMDHIENSGYFQQRYPIGRYFMQVTADSCYGLQDSVDIMPGKTIEKTLMPWTEDPTKTDLKDLEYRLKQNMNPKQQARPKRPNWLYPKMPLPVIS